MFYMNRLQIVNCYIVKSHFSTFKNNLLMMDRCISWKEALARRRAVRSSRVAEHNSVTNDANPHLVGASFEADNGRHFDIVQTKIVLRTIFRGNQAKHCVRKNIFWKVGGLVNFAIAGRLRFLNWLSGSQYLDNLKNVFWFWYLWRNHNIRFYLCSG